MNISKFDIILTSWLEISKTGKQKKKKISKFVLLAVLATHFIWKIYLGLTEKSENLFLDSHMPVLIMCLCVLFVILHHIYSSKFMRTKCTFRWYQINRCLYHHPCIWTKSKHFKQKLKQKDYSIQIIWTL